MASCGHSQNIVFRMMGQPQDFAEGRSELLAEEGSPHSFPRAGQGSAIPVISGPGAGSEVGGVQQWVMLHRLLSY